MVYNEKENLVGKLFKYADDIAVIIDFQKADPQKNLQYDEITILSNGKIHKFPYIWLKVITDSSDNIFLN
jgi:hypothetical protein